MKKESVSQFFASDFSMVLLFLGLSLPAVTASAQGVNTAAPTDSVGTFTDQTGNSVKWYASKDPASVTPKETIVIAMHGFKDHALAYTRSKDMALLKDLPSDRTLVAFNQPTFGERLLIEGEPPHEVNSIRGETPLEQVTSIKEFSDRYGKFVELIAARYPENPILLLGHSLGGQVVARYLEDNRRELPKNVKAALLSSPALGLPPSLAERWVKAPLAQAIGAIPGIRKLPVLPDFLAPKKMADPVEYEFYQEGDHPEAHTYSDIQNNDSVALEPIGDKDSGTQEWFVNLPRARKQRAQAAAELEKDWHARQALHNWQSARATIVGMKELAALIKQRNEALPIPVAVSHFDKDLITTPEASYEYVQTLKAKEALSKAPHQSVWENGLTISQTSQTFYPRGTLSVKAYGRHAVPTFDKAPPALARLWESNPAVASQFGLKSLPKASQAPRFRIQRSRLPLIFKPRLKAIL